MSQKRRVSDQEIDDVLHKPEAAAQISVVKLALDLRDAREQLAALEKQRFTSLDFLGSRGGNGASQVTIRPKR